MKKIIYFSVISLLGLAAACTKNNIPQQPVEVDTIAVTVVPEFSKTTFNTNNHTGWEATDVLGVAYTPLNMTNWIDSEKQFTATVTGQTATFSGSIAAPSFAGKYNLYAIHPYKAGTEWTSLNSVKINLPAEQKANNESFDSNADILVSDAAQVDITKTTSSLSDVKMSFARVNSMARVRTGGISLAGVNGSDAVLSVKLSTDANVSLSGDMTIDMADYKSVSMTNGSKEVKVVVSGATITTLSAVMNVAPVTIPSGSNVTIVIETLDYNLSKTTTLSSDWVFNQNDVKNIVCTIDDSWTKQGSSSEFEGSGTAEDPYLIQTVRDMLRLSQYTNDAATYVNYTDKYYKLTADIDMSAAGNFSPLCATAGGHTFKGVLDGNGHSLYNLTMSTSTKTVIGLFIYLGYKDDGATLGATAVVKDLKLGTKDGSTYDGVSKVTFTSNSTGWTYVSAFCAMTYNLVASGIDNYIPVEVLSTSTSKNRVAAFSAIVQYRSTYTNCNNYGSVTNNNRETSKLENLTGGMFGSIANSTAVKITSCTNYGDVYASAPSSSCIGGVLANVGSAQYLDMSYCKNYGNLTVSGTKNLWSGTQLGGVTGYINSNTGTMSHCENYGKLTADFVGMHSVGGILARSAKNPKLNSSVNYGEIVVNVNPVIDSVSVGGVCGCLGGGLVIDGCVNKGKVSATNQKATSILNVGGIAGVVPVGTQLKNSGEDADVTGTATILKMGGVVGGNYGTTTNCAVKGSVGGTTLTSENFTGFIYGENKGTITGTTYGSK